MIKTNREEYDLIVSLGGSCNVASQLRHRGLRVCSLPLDWTLMVDERPIQWLLQGIRSRFEGFCQRENVYAFEPPAEEYGTIKQRLQDKVSGFRFIHHFSATPDNEILFNKERSVIQRRIDRFYDKMSESHNVLFVLSTIFSYEQSIVEELYHAISETFPNVNIELVCIQFSARTSGVKDLINGNVHIKTCERPVNIVYDNQLTAPEWAFLDQLLLKGRRTPKELRKKCLALKIQYKLWMWLGRRLENAGAGCANMRFYKFSDYH